MSQKPQHEWTFMAIGTTWWIGLYQEVSNSKLNNIKQAMSERIELFDQTYSRFRSDSLVTKISKKAGSYKLPLDGIKLLNFYDDLYKLTDGKVTPCIGNVLSDAGYDAKYSMKVGNLSKPPKWNEAIIRDKNKINVKQPVNLDFGAAGKGYLVDIVSKLLESFGVEKFCIDGSGDIRCKGLDDDLRIALEHPDDPNLAIGVVKFKDGSLCGSAGNRRKWADFNHIINPNTLESITDVKAVWVSAEEAMVSDGLATALFFVSPSKLSKYYSFAYCIIYADNSLNHSANFSAELFND